jgi:hypothetical protein
MVCDRGAGLEIRLYIIANKHVTVKLGSLRKNQIGFDSRKILSRLSPQVRPVSATIIPMPCLVVIVVLAFPRVALVMLWLFTHYLQRAYHGLLIPLIGFFFLPLTTLAYAWMVNNHQALEGVNAVILIVAVIIDVGGLGGGEYHRRRWD